VLLKSNDFVVKRVKTALLFNDKYKQGYSYIMPSQIQLDTDIAIARANVAKIQAQILAASQGTTTLSGIVIPPDPLEIANLEASLATAQATLTSLETQLANLNVTTDPSGTATPAIPPTPVTQTPINPNTDPNTNIGAEIQNPVPQDGGVDPYVSNGTTTIEPSPQDGGVDPYVSNGTTTIIPESQVNIDDGSDPYVSNGTTTVDTVENNTPEAIGAEDPFEAARLEAEARNNAQAPTESNTRGLSTTLQDTRSKATQQDVSNFQAKPDWRVRLSLAPGSKYLYNNKGNEGILLPLAATDGVVFPYTPAISVNYTAGYDPTELTHSNYKFFTYRGSSVDIINISCEFTAQDTFEANYLLAVIHFFKSVTKMFYGQDQNPKIGTPPPLCYLSGLGAFQFDAHPLAITSFNYSLPTDVDYIRAGSTPTPAGVNRSSSNIVNNVVDAAKNRLGVLNPGGVTSPPQFNPNSGTRDVTYVPTKMQIQISAVPIVTRNDISNKFSLTEYATGKLLRGTQHQGGGIW
jgi:hypothetical protein